MDNTAQHNVSWKRIFFNTFLFCFGSLICIIIYLLFVSKDLPSLDELQKFNPDQVSKIISSDGEVLKKLYVAKRDMVSINVIPENLRNALLSMEDRDFYNHNGINIKGIMRAVIVDLVNLSAKQGASTLTQQLARTMYESIGMERSILRKIKEFITAIKIEQTYTKSEILESTIDSITSSNSESSKVSALTFFFKAKVGASIPISSAANTNKSDIDPLFARFCSLRESHLATMYSLTFFIPRMPFPL